MNSQLWRRALVSVVIVVVGACNLWGGDPAVDYHLVHKYEFGAAPGGREYFDYIKVDPASRRVYLSHGTEVLVVNADTGVLESKISGLKLSHGVALVPDQDRGFITDGEQGKIVIFDLKTLKVIGDVNAAKDADSILYDPVSRHVFSFNGDSHSATVLDPANGRVVGTIALGGAPEFAIADDRGMILRQPRGQKRSRGDRLSNPNHQITLANITRGSAGADRHRPRSPAIVHFGARPPNARSRERWHRQNHPVVPNQRGRRRQCL